MKLKIKLLTWSAGIPVAMLKEKTAEKLGVHAQDRVLIRVDGKNQFTTILDTVKSGLLKENEVAVSSEIQEILQLKKKQKVDIELSPTPKSLNFIKKKLNNNTLSQSEVNEIIKDIVNNSLSEAEIALFISAMYKYGMNFKETVYLIKAILKSGAKLNLKNRFLADKHCIGGIAGNRTTPLVVSICAAGGLVIPKSSSRAITSAAGTADVIETIAKVDFSMKELKKIIKKTKGCMIWGGSLEVVTADSKIIHIEKMLKIDPESQLLASIMSKKLAMGSKYILIDIPYGDSAKVSKKKALHLKKRFEALGKYFKKKIKVVLTDGSQPIGNGIGPILELIDVIKVLNPSQQGPKDLTDKAVFLSGELFELAGKAKKGKGTALAREILSNGKAFEKFKQIIEAQKGKIKKIGPGKYSKNMLASKSGKIKSINNKKISSLARAAGCPADKASGLYLHFHKGDKVKKRQPLLTIYAESKSRLREAVRHYNQIKPMTIN